MRRTVRVALCAAAISCVGLLSASSAFATSCPSGRFCVWKDVNFVTNGAGVGYFGFATWSYQFSAHNYNGTSDQVHDDSSSWHNNGNTNYAKICIDIHYGGSCSQPKPPGDNQNNMTAGWDNATDSACFLGGSPLHCLGP